MNNTDLNTLFGDIADSIRDKEGTQGSIKPENFASKITNLPSGLNFNHFYFGTDEPDASRYKYWDIPSGTPIYFSLAAYMNSVCSGVSSNDLVNVTEFNKRNIGGSNNIRCGEYVASFQGSTLTSGGININRYNVVEGNNEIGFCYDNTTQNYMYISLPNKSSTYYTATYTGNKDDGNNFYVLYKTAVSTYKLVKVDLDTNTTTILANSISFGQSSDVQHSFMKVLGKDIFYYSYRQGSNNTYTCYIKRIDCTGDSPNVSTVFTYNQNTNVQIICCDENYVAYCVGGNNYNFYVSDVNTNNSISYNMQTLYSSIDSNNSFWSSFGGLGQSGLILKVNGNEVYLRHGRKDNSDDKYGHVITKMTLISGIPTLEPIVTTDYVFGSSTDYKTDWFVILAASLDGSYIKISLTSPICLNDDTEYEVLYDTMNNIGYTLENTDSSFDYINIPDLVLSASVVPDMQDTIIIPVLRLSSDEYMTSRYLCKVYLDENETAFTFIALNEEFPYTPQVYYNNNQYDLYISDGTQWYTDLDYSFEDVIENSAF